MKSVALLVVASVIFLSSQVSAQKNPPLKRLQTIPLPDVKAGDFDHFAVDLVGNRLFLTGGR